MKLLKNMKEYMNDAGQANIAPGAMLDFDSTEGNQ